MNPVFSQKLRFAGGWSPVGGCGEPCGLEMVSLGGWRLVRVWTGFDDQSAASGGAGGTGLQPPDDLLPEESLSLPTELPRNHRGNLTASTKTSYGMNAIEDTFHGDINEDHVSDSASLKLTNTLRTSR